MFYFALISLLISTTNGYKLLVFSPTIGRSHMIANGRLADELAKAGHDVILFEPDFLKIADIIQPVKYARRWIVGGFSDGFTRVISNFNNDIFDDQDLFNLNMRAYQAGWNAMCKELIENDTLLEELRDHKFDAFYGGHLNLCGHGLAHAIGIKIKFWVFSSPVFEPVALYSGISIPFSYTPALGNSLSLRPTYFERARNLLFAGVGYVMTIYDQWRTTQVFRNKFGPNFPNVGYLAGNSDIIFVTADEFIEIRKPTMPNMVTIGLLGELEQTKMMRKFEVEADKGEKGFIYVSFGTYVNTTVVGPTVMENIAELAKAFPDYHFLVKVDATDTFTKALAHNFTNFQPYDWMPQPALLNHPRIRLFITHAGYNGLMEAAKSGVPLLTIPFVFDQPYNALSVERAGWGLQVHKRTLRDNPQEVVKTVKELLTKERYKETALRLQKLIHNKPFNGSQKLIKTTEFVIANGGLKELLADGRQLSFIEHDNLDILIPLCFVFCEIFRRVVLAAYRVCIGLFGRQTKMKSE